MMEVEACRVLPGQMVQTISADVGDAAAVEKAMGEAVAKQGPVQVRGWVGEATESVGGCASILASRQVGSCQHDYSRTPHQFRTRMRILLGAWKHLESTCRYRFDGQARTRTCCIASDACRHHHNFCTAAVQAVHATTPLRVKSCNKHIHWRIRIRWCTIFVRKPKQGAGELRWVRHREGVRRDEDGGL